MLIADKSEIQVTQVEKYQSSEGSEKSSDKLKENKEKLQSDQSHYQTTFNRRLSSRTVQTKYGSIRGTILNFGAQPSARNLQPIETFLGKNSIQTYFLRLWTLFENV